MGRCGVGVEDKGALGANPAVSLDFGVADGFARGVMVVVVVTAEEGRFLRRITVGGAIFPGFFGGIALPFSCKMYFSSIAESLL